MMLPGGSGGNMKGAKMDIRKLGVENIEMVKEMMLAIFSAEPWNDVWTDEQLQQYVYELICGENSLCFGAYKDGAPVGIALGRIKSWYEGTEYWIEEFGILPARQERGLGSEFMEAVEKELTAYGIAYIVLLTERNVPAYHFYKKNGFEEKKENVFFAKAIIKC